MNINGLRVRTCAVSASLCFALAGASSVAGGLNKCVHQDGSVSYQQGACPADAAASQVAVDPATRPGKPMTAEEARRFEVASEELERARQRLEATQRAAQARTSKPLKQKGRKVNPARPSEVTEATMDRRVIRGMSQAEVRESLGAPSSVYTDSGGYESWTYRTLENGSYRSSTVTFDGGLSRGWDNYSTR